ncbi:MAG TPA: hypothetical protein PLN91_07630, partial [Rhodanobacteraceae bacterium]|nr:hypothetical protein [Rhodanobacteraceae bacterium]
MTHLWQRLVLDPLRHAPRSRTYAWANAAGWTLYTLLNLSVIGGIGKLSGGMGLMMVALTLWIFLAQHWLLGLARSRDWY